MTVTVDFTPQEEAWLDAQTRRQGVSPAEVIKSLVDDQIAASNGTRSAANVGAPAGNDLEDKRAAAIAYLERRLREEATDDPEEIRRSQEEFDELQRNLNANRDLTGERHVFP